MKFKFSIAIILSVILHISLFALAIWMPQFKGKSGTVYYVDLMQMPGGGGGGGQTTQADTGGQLVEDASIRDLTVKKEEPKPKLRYPDENKKKKKTTTKKKKPRKLVSVVKKKPIKKKPSAVSVQRKGRSDSLRTGISSGSGGGSGGGIGSGSGSGTGSGSGIGNFPYAYYIETLKNKISSSWYSSLVSPGLKGNYNVVVYFRIMRSGRVSDLRVQTESGHKSLDLSAIRAVKAASPFPQLPGDFPYQYLGVHFEFQWARK